MTTPEATAALGAAFAESIMSATCELRQRDGGTTTDPQTGETTPTPGTLVYAGKCHIRPGSGAPVAIEGGEAFTYDFQVSLPAAVTGVTGGQLLTVTDSPDPDLVGRLLEVAEVDRGDYRTARRLQCNGMAV
jgi:hypothetical protein